MSPIGGVLIVVCGFLAGCAEAPAPKGVPPSAVEGDRPREVAAAAVPDEAAPAPTPPPAPAPSQVAESRPAADGRIREITFDDVKLPLEKGDPFSPEILPPAVRALERQRVRIRGYILPSFQQKGITQFVLVRDNMECCFGPGALLHDCVVVRMTPGRSADFSIRPVAVSGTFRIEELKGPDGKHLAVYALDGEEVK